VTEIIRSTLKGNSQGPDSGLEEWKTFENIPSVPTDAYMDRLKVYELAHSYQFAIRSRGLWDDMDAAGLMYQSYRQQFPAYDAALVDEVQDYTQVQLRFMTALSKSTKGLVYVGDMDQVLYPSQFNWKMYVLLCGMSSKPLLARSGGCITTSAIPGLLWRYLVKDITRSAGDPTIVCFWRVSLRRPH
jgi:hypothetical protein